MLMNKGNNMRLFVYLAVFAVVFMMMCATGCTEKKTEVADTIADTLSGDTIAEDIQDVPIEEAPMPKSADELFDDFIFNFAGNKSVQLQRIQFPLTVNDNGVVTEVKRQDWTFDTFFMQQGFYTLVMSRADEIETAKDTKVGHVVIEKVQLSAASVRQHVFNRVNGLWMLQSISNVPLTDHPNGEFYSFCDKFMRDSIYRMEHMAENVEFSGPDPDDDFMRMEGFIMPEQVSMFAPELPQGKIYNIVYGDVVPHGDDRILVIRGIANGFEIELTFSKKDSGYVLVKLVV